MSSAAERVVREHFEATNRRDFAKVMSTYAPDVELVTTTGPLAGTHRGREAVGGYFGDWLSSFGRDAHFDLLEVRDAGAHAVAVVARHRASGARSGVTVDANFFYAYWVTGGLIVRVEMHDTREEAFRAAGLAP